MMNLLAEYEKMTTVYLQEALCRLQMQEDDVRLEFVPSFAGIMPIDIGVFYHPGDATINVSRAWLSSLIAGLQVTVLRNLVYVNTRYAYQYQKRGVVVPDMPDAIAFSLALLATKGLSLSKMTDLLAENYDQRVIDILKQEFGLDARIQNVPAAITDGNDRWYVDLSPAQEQQMIEAVPTECRSTVQEIPAQHTGTKDDPFDNVDDAFDYIRQLEAKAYDNDAYLRRIAEEDYYYDFHHHQFRYPFASPFIAYYRNDFPKDSFIVNQNAPHPDGKFYFTIKPNLFGRKFLYRGQNEDYSPKPCVPNLFRNPDKKYFLDDMIWGQEMELLINTHPLVKLLDGGVELVKDHFAFLMNIRGLLQHYYHRTSLLDYSSQEDVAKFFAVTDYNSTKDEYYPVAHTDKPGVIYLYELQLPSAFQMHPNGTMLSVIGKQVFMRSGAQHGFLLDMPRGLDMKTLPEVRAVYFRHDMAISERIFKASDSGKRFFAEDLLEKAWKQEYKERMEKGIVSDATVRLNVSRNSGETYDSIRRKLAERGIQVNTTYTPCFCQDLLADYYADIKNGWWEEFCHDVYFSGADGFIYKDALLRLSSDERYKWAFNNPSINNYVRQTK